MQKHEISKRELLEGKNVCLYCQQTKPLQAFSQQTGKTNGDKKICDECDWFKKHERHHRMKRQREIWQQQQQEREARRPQEWERRVAFHRLSEDCWQERENWYRHQPDRRCKACHQVLPATAFGGIPSANGFTLHTRCKPCHEAYLAQHQLPCCFCQKKTPRRDFLSHFNGYALCGNGIALSLCCKGCETAFCMLSPVQQGILIRSCCQRAFPAGQVIYAECDPETSAIRYVGRTGKPKRRHAQHLQDTSATLAVWGTERKAWYTRGNWIHALAERGLQPSMQILRTIVIPSLVVEWEQRSLWHGIQQGWNLLNSEMMDEELVARVKASSLDFFAAPFELLLQKHFFASHELPAFLHYWHLPACLSI